MIILLISPMCADTLIFKLELQEYRQRDFLGHLLVISNFVLYHPKKPVEIVEEVLH